MPQLLARRILLPFNGASVRWGPRERMDVSPAPIALAFLAPAPIAPAFLADDVMSPRTTFDPQFATKMKALNRAARRLRRYTIQLADAAPGLTPGQVVRYPRGLMLRMTSGIRTTAQQAAITGPKAPAGRSLHEIGRAVDVVSDAYGVLGDLGTLTHAVVLPLLAARHGLSALYERDHTHLSLPGVAGFSSTLVESPRFRRDLTDASIRRGAPIPGSDAATPNYPAQITLPTGETVTGPGGPAY